MKDGPHKQTLAEQIGGRCVHYNGTINPICDAGVRYTDVREEVVDWRKRLPCFREGLDTCGARKFPSAEEIAAEEAEWAALVSNMARARSAIVEATGGKRGVAGSIVCPCCEGGTLQYSVAGYNGHIAAECSTPGCANWME